MTTHGNLLRPARCGPLAKPLLFAACLAASLALPVSGVGAKPPEVRVQTEADLRFGSFMVFGSGARSVSVAGAVTDQAIVAVEGTTPGPGRFTIQYDRGNESRQPLDVTLELTFVAPALYRQAGVEARLSAFETDLPGYARVAPGETMQVRFSNCRTRVCSRSFNLGARLDTSRQYGGADLVIPIDFDARIVSAERL